LFVRRARELGFSLDEVRTPLRVTGRRSACAEVKTITEQHIAGIRRRINELTRLERALGALVAQCRGDEIPDCPILDALAAPCVREMQLGIAI
jgi:MerR family mercuric resistance operon transcriptional regulator